MAREIGRRSPIGARVSKVIAAAYSSRRPRSQIASLWFAAIPSGLPEKALMLIDVVSAALADAANDSPRGELLCFVGSSSSLSSQSPHFSNI